MAGACTHCGLPCGPAASFCCYGCEVAAELTNDAGPTAHTRASLALSALLSMGVMMLALVLYAEDVYDVAEQDAMETVRGVFRLGAAVLATPVVALLGLPMLSRAVRRRRASVELLIASGAFAAYGLSMYAVATGDGSVYFDTACAALVLTTLGRYLEARARASANARIGADVTATAQPVPVREGDAWVDRAPVEIQTGAALRVPEGRPVPVDAVVDAGPVDVSLAIVTGESRPVTLGAGDPVMAGAVPLSGELSCTAARPARESTLARLEELARGLREHRAPIQRTADRFAAAFVPIVYALAATSFAYWAFTASADRGVVVALAVVLAACPCTYGVATPLALWVSLRAALHRGALVRDASTLEALARVRGVAFDKTGTLTRDTAVRVVYTAPGIDRDEALAVAAGLEASSPHPIARAIRDAAAGLAPADVTDRTVDAGVGVRGHDADGRDLFLGKADAPDWAPTGAVVLVRNGSPIAAFDVGESLHPHAAEAVDRLRDSGMTVRIVTGDDPTRATRVAEQLRIDATAAMSPADKAAGLDEHTAMVGDGLNDAPALARSQPSFAVLGGTGLARGMASVALLDDDLRLVPWTLDLARRTQRVIRSNLTWATIYNAGFVALAAAGMLKPVFAALAMITSSAIVVGRTLALGSTAGPEEDAP